MPRKITPKESIRKRKPAITIEDRISALEEDKAYTPEELSAQWKFKDRTVRDIARKIDCLRYIKDGEGPDGPEWVEVILHPNTAKRYR